MSIALAAEVYDEARRLAVAGSAVAPGDFRLKKLIAPLEQVGAKAPVFLKVAEGVKAVVAANEKSASAALLDLATLASAILYTQGETGAEGELQPIETSDLGLTATQTGARVLKPLLEALSTTGSGRLETIRAAFDRGAFKDLRLIQPSVRAIDDVFPEIAELIADKILPLYGKAILPGLRASFELKGKVGHARRLRLMHRLDPAATRDTVKEALEGGSKEVKLAAIECLGHDQEDLSYLLEQAAAKAQDVRQAAYRALASFDDGQANAVLQKAFDGKDLELATRAIARSKSATLQEFVRTRVQAEWDALPKLKDKKEIGAKIVRLEQMLESVASTDPANEPLLLKLFADRAARAKLKGDPSSGADLVSTLVRKLGDGTPALVAKLAEAHAELGPEDLGTCFAAALKTLPKEQVFDAFASYLTPAGGKKDPKRDAIIHEIDDSLGFGWSQPGAARFDPRWLDQAVAMADLGVVASLIRPGNDGVIRFLSKAFAERLKAAKDPYDLPQVVTAMARAQHPDATDAAIALIQKMNKKPGYLGYYFEETVASLPKAALPKLEALVPTLEERHANPLLGYIQQLRDRPD